MKIDDSTGNPAPLGLMGFGMTTILLNIHNAGFFAVGSMIMMMGLFYGGLAQIIAGIMEWKKENTFGSVAFTSYGFFWLTLVGIFMLPKFGFPAPETFAMASYLGLWGLFTLGLFICTFKMNRALQVVFGTLVVLFALLTVADATGNGVVKIVAGYEGIVCGLSAMYTSLAIVINTTYKKKILPVG